MILTKLSITNFGIYQGTHEFDLRPRSIDGTHRPIILIGGKNGAGKTTFLQAIRLCLYGRLALGSRVRRSDYDAYIQQRFHRPLTEKAGASAKSIHIGLVFEHVHAGKKNNYDAIRSWKYKGTAIEENVSIFKNGEPLRDIASEHWNDFLRDMIPPGVADLFFFDGEQIQMLADEESERTALETAINGLLNLDLVERLQSDLTIYLRQRSRQQQTKLKASFDRVTQEHDRLDQILAERKQDRASIVSELAYVRKTVDEARQSLLEQGAHFIEQHAQHEARLIQVERDIEQHRTAIRELATGLLPFSYTPKWLSKTQDRLNHEAEIQTQQLLHQFEEQKTFQIRQQLRQRDFQDQIAPTLKVWQWERLIEELEKLIAPNGSSPAAPLQIHHVSEQKRNQLLSQIEQATMTVPVQLVTLSKELEALASERSNLQQKIRQVPEAEVAEPLIETFQKRSEQIGKLDGDLKQIEKQIGRTEYEMAEVARERSKLWHKIADSGDLDKRVDQVAKVQIVLEQYLVRITTLKLKELESLIAEFFNRLCRKELLVKEVKIDVKRYAVTLYGENRTELPKSGLSAGEKQLYAMSLLWALRAVSGRQLPIIVDTPLGRLDRTHRERLISDFFPNAAHQVVLLSTDSEVDADSFALLQPHISHLYRLDFDPAKGTAQIVDGYFATNQSVEAA
ncbi:MAG: DNA sulfur modification protein DndD [Candidatus Promineifilaceae bacterium]